MEGDKKDKESNGKVDNARNALIDNSSILRTKIYKPKIRREFVKRSHLGTQLEVNSEKPMTLICAPSGYGKSVLVSQWLEEVNSKYGWLTLDNEHNDVHIFVGYLVTIFKQHWPNRTFLLESLLLGSTPSSNLVAKAFINDIDGCNERLILVLDDYHVIKDDGIHEIINEILLFPPQNLHLVIISRLDPPLKLARLRSQFRLNELRVKDLAFRTKDAIRLCKTINVNASQEQLNQIVEQAEGWITGITAGLLGLKQGLRMDEVIDAMHHNDSVIAIIVNSTVVQGLPKQARLFIDLSTLLDRFSSSLLRFMVNSVENCELTEDDIIQMLHASQEKNLFLIPLDVSGEWFRYHHLFQAQIQNYESNSFSPEQKSLLYKAASRWFEENGLLEEAMHYAVLSEDFDFAVRLFDRYRLGMHNSEQFQKLERLLHLFPVDVVQGHLPLLLSLAILQDHKANFAGMQEYLTQAEKILKEYQKENPDYKAFKGQINAVKAYLAYMKGDYNATIHQSASSLDLLPMDEPNYFREFALAYYAMAQQATGNKEIGLETISKTFENRANHDRYFKGRLLHIEILIHSIAGNAREMLRPGLQLQALVADKSYPSAWLAGVLGIVTSAYISNNLERVYLFHDELVKFRYGGRPFGIIHHFFVECLASMALGEWDKVDTRIEECHELATALGIEPLQGTVYAFEVEAALARGNIDHAVELSVFANFEPHPPLWYYYIPQLTKVRLLFYTSKPGKSLDLLDSLIVRGKNLHNDSLLIQALALKATLLEKLGDHSIALQFLEEALMISAKKDHIRTFIDQGDEMRTLINEISSKKIADEQVKRIKQAFDETTSQTKSQESIIKQPQETDNILSFREMDILRLVAEGNRNDEIAEKLFISLDTVKKHLYNAYQKLNVSNRAAAIRKIQELGLVQMRS